MANAKFEFFDDERDAVMELLLLASDLFDLKETKPPRKNHESGKNHLYLETKDHKRRTGAKMKD